MKKVIHKIFWLWEFEKEERWLNQLSAQGLQLTDVSLYRYVFEEGQPGAYQYRLEMLDRRPEHPESQAYIRFMEDTGAEQIGSLNSWVYFRKRTTDGPFELFSDIDSRVKHLQRINSLLLLLLAGLLLTGCGNLLISLNQDSVMNLISAVPCLLLAAFLGSGSLTISRQLLRLKQEREIRE